MIEATCAACGTLNRVSETTVPIGAKFITCADCKSRVAIPMTTAVTPKPPPLPRPPPIPVPPPAKATDVIDLADLPAPKRVSALGSLPAAAPAPPRPALPPRPMRSGLAAALDPELPAPKAARSPGMAAPSLDLDDDLEVTPPVLPATDSSVDLPAPKRPVVRPVAETQRAEVPDLPAPRPSRAAAEPPQQRPPAPRNELPQAAHAPPEIADLPAPKHPPEIADLLAPKPARASADPPAPRQGPTIADPPAPRQGPTIADLPAPRAADLQRAHRNSELPAPRGFFGDAAAPDATRDAAAAGTEAFFDDLPQPKGVSSSHPAEPSAPRGMFDALPQPNRAQPPELPAPKGFFDDLPQPSRVQPPELPAPKGFFDDLPQPARTQPPGLPAPKGFFDDRAPPPLAETPELPAPKGFFDDLPQPALQAGGSVDLPAPQGYFDDLPGRTLNSKPELPAPQGYFDDLPGRTLNSKPELPAPQGYFENVPGLPLISKPEVPAPQGFFDNLPARPIKKADELAPKGFFDDPHRDGAGSTQHAERDPGSQAGVEIDFQAPPRAASSFDDLDLSKPSTAVRFDATTRAPAAAAQRPAHAESGQLQLEGAPPTLAAASPAAQRPGKQAPVLDPVATASARARRNKLVLGGVLALAVLGGGGFLLYQRHAAAVEREAELTSQLATAREAYAASDARHWQRAGTAAREVVALDPLNPEALGIATEALFASALGDGTGATTKRGQARAMLDAANGAGISTPILARSRALAALVEGQPDAALAQLKPLIARAPKDGALALYQGWALAAQGDQAGAVAAYDRATLDPAVKLAALYGRGNARLERGDLAGARADFTAVLELSRDHIGAQVGLAAAQPPAAAQQQEADVLAILARKDIAGADPRAVARAWTLAGGAARKAGRFDVARERFRKALAAVAQDVEATTGLAETELRDGKVTAAAELTAGALAVAKDNVPAQLLQSEIEIKQNNLPLATKRLAALASHPTPLGPRDEARLHLVTGKLHEAEGKDDEAVDAYARGAKAAGDLDLMPLMAGVAKLSAMTQAAIAAKDDARASELRARSEQLLGELGELAEREPNLAMTVGVAFLQVGNTAKAELWLRRVVEARPGDAEAWFQLGRALLKNANAEEALRALLAASERDPARADIGVELARTHEALGHDAEAAALYGKLLAGPEPSLELRGRAGRFFARTGALDKAGEQGTKIVAADPNNAAGLYLKGEGLLVVGKALEAKQVFQRAVDLERDPQYLDALGRAAEALSQTGDRELQDLALRSYLAAAEAVPPPFNALAGQGRLYVARHEAAKAITPLLAAARIDSRNPDVMFLLGAAYQELQQATTALQWLEASAKLAPRADAFWRIGQLYRDANKGAQAAAALGSANRLAAEAEKKTGKPTPWLTDSLYLQGRVSLDLHSDAIAREAWLLYVARNPPPSAQLTEVKQLLATALRR